MDRLDPTNMIKMTQEITDCSETQAEILAGMYLFWILQDELEHNIEKRKGKDINMGGHNKIPLDMSEIHEMRQAGMSYREIAAIYGCSHTTILKRYKKWQEKNITEKSNNMWWERIRTFFREIF